MADITMRRTGELVRKVFEVLLSSPEGMKAGGVIKRVSELTTLTEFERGHYSDGSMRYDKIVRFATIGAVKAGWIIKHKGVWSVTEEGVLAYRKYSDPEAFYREAGRLYSVWKRGREPLNETQTNVIEFSTVAAEEEPEFEQFEEKAWEKIEKYLQLMPWHEVQNLVGDLLRAMDYHVIWEAQPGQKGSDIIAFQDPLGTQSPRIRVEVKSQQSRIDLDNVKAFTSSISAHDVGVYVSIGGFTKDAGEYARNHETRRITLIDAEKLVELWIQHSAKLSDSARKRLDLVPVYFLAPRE